MKKPTFCICENKDADQFGGNRKADQPLCFQYTDSTIPLLSKSEISSLYQSSLAVQPGLSQTRSESRKLVFSWRRSFTDPDSLVSLPFRWLPECILVQPQSHISTKVLKCN